jgi:FAD/FMN-containing dehydrogenase
MCTEDRRAVRGPVVRRGERDYEPTRRAMLWNARKPERYPELIVTATSRDDVRAAVWMARVRGMRVAVRGGGHSWCGTPLRDGGMLIDLSALRDVDIDPASRSAWLGPVVSNRALVAALAEHGLCFPVGHCGQVVASGYLLAGGFGWNTRAWGPACLSVLEIEMVDARGDVVRASERENAELFWAARGAGAGFFGVVTRYRIGLYPLPRAIVTTSAMFAPGDWPEAARWASALGETLDPTAEPGLILTTPPPGVASPATKVAIVSVTAFADTGEQAAAVLAPVEGCPLLGRALAHEAATPTTFDALFDVAEAFWPEGRRYAADTAWTNADLGDVVAGLRDVVLAAPSRESLVLATPSPNPPGIARCSDAAFAVRGRTLLDCYAVWRRPAEDEANETWLRDATAVLDPVTAGHYVGETDLTAAPTRAARCYPEHTWRRLRELRAQLDPDGVFHTYPHPG